ncbi:MAG: redoxin domain-containing protein [Acidobacteriota bacterium]|nr:redoxin domain-containing protein [Acidobacteriota bacterium]
MLFARKLMIASLAVLVASAPGAMAQAKKKDAGQQKDLESRVAALEQRLASLEKQVAQSGAPSQEAEQKAAGLMQEVQNLVGSGDFQQAKTKLAALNKDYAGTNAQRRAARLNQELAVIGKAAPKSYDIVKWYQGENEVSLADGKATLLVFWEVWCPHCRREVPKMESLYTRYKGKGLQVVGLTKITKSATEQGVLDFMREQKVSYPVAKESGQVSRYFNVSGIPAAAVVKDGKIVWRGHPASLNDGMLEKLIGG